MRIITGPTVQLGLDLSYPSLGSRQSQLQFVSIRRRTPSIPHSPLPTCWSPSPCTRLSRARTTTGPPSCPTAISWQRACPPLSWRDSGRATADSSHVHMTSINQVGGQLYPDNLATPTPQTFSVASPPTDSLGFGVDHPTRRWSCVAPRPLSTRFEPALFLRGFHHWFTFVPPSDPNPRVSGESIFELVWRSFSW